MRVTSRATEMHLSKYPNFDVILSFSIFHYLRLILTFLMETRESQDKIKVGMFSKMYFSGPSD